MTREEAWRRTKGYLYDVLSGEEADEIIKALEQEPKSEWQHDHEILRAYSDGANEVLDKIRAEIEELAKPNEFGGRGNGKSVRYGLCKALEIIDKYKAERGE